MSYLQITSLALCSLFLSACLSPVKTATITHYTLDQTPLVAVSDSQSDNTLLVSKPNADAAYNDQQIVYRDSPHILKSFSRNQWVAPPAQLLQPLLVQALIDNGHYRAVVATPFSGRADRRLDTRLVKLEHDFTTRPSIVRLVIQARLMDSTNNKVIASQRFDIAVESPQTNPQGGVMAANQAVAQVISEIVKFATV